MKETKKMLIIGAIVLVFIIGILIIVFKKEEKDKGIMDQFYELLNSRKYEILYIAKSDCDYCKLFDSNLKEITEVQKIDYLKIYIDKILVSSANEIIERLEIEELGTPYVAIIKDGQVVDNFGYLEPNELLKKFKTYNFVDENVKLSLNYLELGDYYELLSSKKKSVVAFSSLDNSTKETNTFKSVIKEISRENKIEINYFELLFTSDEEFEEFAKTFEVIRTDNIPIIAIIENNKVVDYVSATTSKDEILNLLKDNNMVK